MITKSLIFALLAQWFGIDGQVRDARTHREVSYARVIISDMRVPLDHQYTDPNGRFRFLLPTGRYIMRVESVDYDSATVAVDLTTSSNAGPVIIELTRREERPQGPPEVLPLSKYLVPKAAQREFENARKEATKKDCAKAIPHFETGLRLFDQDATAFNDLGNCYRRMGMMDLAERSFKSATRLSSSVYIPLNLAEVYTAQKRFDEAEAVLLENIRRTPGDGDAHYGLAIFYFNRDGWMRQKRLRSKRTVALIRFPIFTCFWRGFIHESMIRRQSCRNWKCISRRIRTVRRARKCAAL